MESYILLDEDDNLADSLSSQSLIDYLYNEIIFIRQKILDEQVNIKSDYIFWNADKKSCSLCLLDKTKLIWRRKVNYTEQNLLLHANLMLYNDFRVFCTYLMSAIVISRIYQFDQYHFLKCIFQLYKINLANCIEESRLTNNIIRQLMYAKQDIINLLLLSCNQFNKNEYNSMLDEAKNWVGLEKPAMIVMTHVKFDLINKMNLLLIDQPQCELTIEQKLAFDTAEKQSWYNHLTLFQQQLIKYYKKNILSEKCIIPSQLRGRLPLQKNAYIQSLWIKKNKNWCSLNRYYHSGTVAYLCKDEELAFSLTKNNLKQQQKQFNIDVSLMIALNSQLADAILATSAWLYGINYKAEDSAIIKLTKSASQLLTECNIFFSKLCLNTFRAGEFHDYTGIDQFLNVVHQNLIQFNKSDLVAELEKYLNHFNSLRNQWTIIDRENKGLDLIYFLTKIAFLNNAIIHNQSEKKGLTTGICFGCASGENRTGIVCYHNICLTLIDFIEKEQGHLLANEEKQQIYKIIAASQHIQIMTGFQGSALGTEGIRKQSASCLKSFHPVEFLLFSSSERKTIPYTPFPEIENNPPTSSYLPYRFFLSATKWSPVNYTSFMSVKNTLT